MGKIYNGNLYSRFRSGSRLKLKPKANSNDVLFNIFANKK
ncbi:unnamed protein product, partial [Didymodactylos carnosus]